MLISQPSNPSTVLEYENLTLQWNYNLDGQTNALTRIVNVTGVETTVASRTGTNNAIIVPDFENQFIASISDSEAILTILTVPRSFNEEKYRLGVITARNSFASVDVEISVLCEYKALLWSLKQLIVHIMVTVIIIFQSLFSVPQVKKVQISCWIVYSNKPLS